MKIEQIEKAVLIDLRQKACDMALDCVIKGEITPDASQAVGQLIGAAAAFNAIKDNLKQEPEKVW